ncbi:GNAT family N-acetyltransferase [Microbacterium sp. CFBP9034]|uniref:GNAT family N-acetyltransferase n=1 Tax=Microbacterium sp. CFBP9034 TaxID=3096540 RepID=UPI002A6A8991|nr:GNAT family N-acetyltransferase [Microbacterium sp. CFBP9034]MDY0911022.1 GNAT family N-acetyltransferase [Microbacterium sp. CFBP9034]
MTFDTETRPGAPGEADATAFRVAPIHETTTARLADAGLEARLVPVDGDDFPGWLQSTARGFLDGERSEEQIASARERSAFRRTTGIYDPSAPVPDAPVATIASWVGQLTVPGGAAVPSCAISAVTVAPTHRRRGLARVMLEGELRSAVDADLPMAMLTVSESTLYGRYGFAPAAASASWRIETKRATWIGPRPDGRVDFIPRERLRELIAPLHDRARRRFAGEIDVPAGHWDGMAGTHPTAEKAGEKRAIQYADASGEVRGLALYSVKENHDDFTKASVRVTYLLAETDDAYAALWRFLLELDLVAEVNADEQSVDEPLRWMIADQRAATVTLRDHQYVRILDVPRALEARRFGASGTLALDVADPLGHAAGRYLLEVDAEGRGTVTPWESPSAPEGAVAVSLGIEELSAAYLGGVSLATLAAAGRVQSADPSTAARVLAWHTAPRLSIWY